MAIAANRPFHPAGAVPLDSFYVERETDSIYRHGVASGSFHLHGSRQSGKTSLLLRARASLRDRFAVSYVDLASLGAVPFFGDDRLDQRICAAVADDLDLDGRAWSEHAGQEGLTRSLVGICRAVAAPTILMFDELDSLAPDLRRGMCESLRALQQAAASQTQLTVNLSLCGVEPPLGYFNGASSRDGLEPVHGGQWWLDDFPLDDVTVDAWHRGFAHAAAIPREAVRAMLTHAGGYAQACAWLGNLIDAHGGHEELPFDQDFAQRLRELTARFFDPAATLPWSDRQQIAMDTQWIRVIEAFFTEHGATARDGLDVYEQVLKAFEGATAVPYAHGDRRYELLRTSGLARLSTDNALRLRCPLFADAFNRAWIDRMRVRLGGRERRIGRIDTIDKRLLVIGTGGTIGMSENPQGTVGPAPGEAWFEAVEDLVSVVEYESQFDLDSADVGPEQWSQIVRTIVRRQNDFDGVLVAHGTDTMAYTASAVAFALGSGLGFPVVFTGSQTTVDVQHGDAIANLLRASLVATQEQMREVVICFGERIFRATRTQKKDDLRFDAFESPGYPELGFVAEEVQIFEQNLLSKEHSGPLTNVSAEFSSGILHVSQLPGSEAAFYERALAAEVGGQPLCKGIIIQSLGAGNVPTKSAAFDMRDLIREATKRRIPVVLTSQYPVLPANYLRYSPSLAAIRAGAIPTGNMTISAVLAKLSWVLPQVDSAIRTGMLPPERRVDRVRDMMGIEYVGEGGLTIVAEASDG